MFERFVSSLMPGLDYVLRVFCMFLFPFNIMMCGKLSSEAVFFPDGWRLESTLITGTETQSSELTEKSTRGQRLFKLKCLEEIHAV